jgi:gluconolactonase
MEASIEQRRWTQGRHFIEFAVTQAVVAFILSMSSTIGIAAAQDGVGPTEELYVSVELTASGSFQLGLDGIGCDVEGNVYVANLGGPGTIGVVDPAGNVSTFAELPEFCIPTGIQYHGGGFLLVANPAHSNILKVDIETRKISEYACGLASLLMDTPGDIALAANGMAYVCEPDWVTLTGRLWVVDRNCVTDPMEINMGLTAGIALSPDDRILYVSEPLMGIIWAYDLSPQGEISNKRQFVDFPDYDGMAGMACDAVGNLYVTRNSQGGVAKVSPSGEMLLEVELKGRQPTRITFGGWDGRSCYVTLADRGNIETFRVEDPGRDWQLLRQDVSLPTLVRSGSWGQVKAGWR